MPGDNDPKGSRQIAELIYDGECPFCNAYVRMTRVRENLDLRLIDARSGSQTVHDAVAAGFDLNEGFVLKIQERYYHGQEALHTLALLSSRSGLFNRFTTWVFANPNRSLLLYPVLRFCRNTTLRILGRKPLNLTPDE